MDKDKRLSGIEFLFGTMLDALKEVSNLIEVEHNKSDRPAYLPERFFFNIKYDGASICYFSIEDNSLDYSFRRADIDNGEEFAKLWELLIRDVEKLVRSINVRKLVLRFGGRDPFDTRSWGRFHYRWRQY